jgi:hypothetical protein
MALVFAAATRRYGGTVGYRLGFVGYWVTCAALSTAVLGPRELAQRLTPSSSTPLPRPRALVVAALLLPPVGAAAVELVPHLRQAGRRALLTAAAVGLCNGVCEELLWRAVPAAVYPEDPIRGWLWPAAGFTAWHTVPLAVRSHGAGRVLAGAALVGLGSGWLAWSTGPSPPLSRLTSSQTRAVCEPLGPCGGWRSGSSTSDPRGREELPRIGALDPQPVAAASAGLSPGQPSSRSSSTERRPRSADRFRRSLS